MLITGLSDLFHPSLHKKPDMCAKRCLLYSIPLADLARHVFITGLSDLVHPCLQKKPDRCVKRGVWLIPCGVKKQDRQKTGSRTKE